MQTESLDTNILLRFVLCDIEKQRKAAVKLLAAEDTKYNVADIAISEMVYVLDGITGGNRKEISDAVKLVLAQPNILCNRTLFTEALPFYETHPALSFNDCCLAAYAAIDQSEPLWTFDRKLATQSPTAKLA